MDNFVKLAKESLEYYINFNKKMERPGALDKELVESKKACFVTLHIDGELRGCIGTITPELDCLADEIIENAISAGTRDPRFARVDEKELDSLEYSVDVLHEPELVTSKDQLDPKTYGIIITAKNKGALLLPDLEGIETVDEQIAVALRKGNIFPDEEFFVERFQVDRHK